MTMPGAAAHTASITASGRAVPVGLLGEVRNTRSGWCSPIAWTTAAAFRPKSASRLPLIHRVPVAREISGCMA